MAHANYLTYDEYAERGGELLQASFIPLELKCRKRLDYLTDSRIQNMAVIPEDVKACMVALIGIENAVGGEKQATQPKVTSFNTDGYSETYGNALSVKDAEHTMNETVRTYLWGIKDDKGIPLLYRGVKVV